MLKLVKRMLVLAGERKKRLLGAIVFSFLEGIFITFPSMLVMFTIYKIVTGTISAGDVRLLAALLIGGIVLRALLRRIVDGLQSGTGYEIFAKERMDMGEHLKRLPMGYFSEGTIGDVTSVLTTDITFIELHGMRSMSTIVNSYVSMILGSIIVFLLDWRIALIGVATFALGNLSLRNMDRIVTRLSEKRQAGIAGFVGAVIEYVRGISVIKACNMTEAEKISRNFLIMRDNAIEYETHFSQRHTHFNWWFNLGVAAIILAASLLGLTNNMNRVYSVLFIIYAFQFFTAFMAIGHVGALVRIMEAGLDRYEKVMNRDVLDEKGEDNDLTRFDIELKNVSFAYDEAVVLQNISFTVPENSMTALVGPSGCGKTTITNLIARFWDVREGQVLVGGIDIRNVSMDSLLKRISMVFQNVYLFNDTILNNIKFGKPDASMDEVIAACKKARCYEFITALEDGFETMVEESGASLSGGEKQRISIARAMLKDAPIILLDEATASVDPDNEQHIQAAINELVKDKTLVVIAHKLSTIRHADQILVLDKGQLVQQGIHQDLISEEGLYKTFWQRRTLARSWKIRKTVNT